MNQFLSIDDVADPIALISKALKIKSNPLEDPEVGKNKTLGLFFFNPSLRTRLSSQRAASNLGLNVMTMNVMNEGWQLEFGDRVIMDGAKAEHIREAAKVISQYCDIIGIRSFAEMKNYDEDKSEKIINGFSAHATKPVISLESCTLHPLQSLADVMTIEENKKSGKPKVVLTWTPHPRALPPAVSNSFSQWMNKFEAEFIITHPKGLDLDPDFVGAAKIIHNQEQAFENADFIYAKNWSAGLSYGKPIKDHQDWKITEKKMALTNNGKFMHCLPVRRNVLVEDAVLDSENSLVIEQADNRTYAAQTVLKELLT